MLPDLKKKFVTAWQDLQTQYSKEVPHYEELPTQSNPQIQRIQPQNHFEVRNQLLEDIKQAHKEWQLAQHALEFVDDPDMIDYVIFQLDAAEKKYSYLLKQARKLEVQDNRIQFFSHT